VYVVKKDGECFVVREDTQQKKLLAGPYEEVADVVFSPDGRWTAFWAKRDNQWRVVAAGTDGSRRSTRNAYDGYGEGTLAFSFDSKRLAFVGVREKQAVVVVKGVEYGPYDAILEGTPVFSPNSQRLAYGACQQGTWRVVVDGKERDATYGLIKEHSLQFTPDNQHVVYVASYGDTGKSMAIAVDGELSNDYLFPLGSKMVFNDPKSFQTVAVTGNLLPDSDGKNLRLENGQFVRVDVQIRTD
jgi:WD40 repeat protein